jgi:hypothetical protein
MIMNAPKIYERTGMTSNEHWARACGYGVEQFSATVWNLYANKREYDAYDWNNYDENDWN